MNKIKFVTGEFKYHTVQITREGSTRIMLQLQIMPLSFRRVWGKTANDRYVDFNPQAIGEAVLELLAIEQDSAESRQGDKTI